MKFFPPAVVAFFLFFCFQFYHDHWSYSQRLKTQLTFLIHMHLTLQLITCVEDSQKLKRLASKTPNTKPWSKHWFYFTFSMIYNVEQ